MSETTSEPEIKDSEENSDWHELAERIEAGNSESVAACLEALSPADLAHDVSRLSEVQQAALVQLVGPELAAEVIDDLPEAQAADLMGELKAPDAAEIFHELDDDARADLLGEMSPLEVAAILDEMPAESADVARRLLDFDPECAGGLMTTELVRFRDDQTAEEAITELRRNQELYSDYSVQYAYVVDAQDRLRGVLRLRDLVLSGKGVPLDRLMIADPLSIGVDSGLDELVGFFEQHSFVGVPVVDAESRLVGVLEERVVREATAKRARKTFLKVSGIIGGEELRSMPLGQRSLRRLAFLAPNIVLNIVAASVIAVFQDTLQAVIVLAVFLPIISDMSGCSGNQAVAVSIRELALGLIRPHEVWRIFLKEGALGLINGTMLGLLLGTVAAVWQQNIYLGLVVGGALSLNTMLSVLMGGLVPLVLKRFKVDPALASGPILTTVTDMCGFFLVLSFASAMLDRL